MAGRYHHCSTELLLWVKGSKAMSSGGNVDDKHAPE